MEEEEWEQGREQKELRSGKKSLPANCSSLTTGEILVPFSVLQFTKHFYIHSQSSTDPVRSDLFTYKLDTFSILRAFLKSKDDRAIPSTLGS